MNQHTPTPWEIKHEYNIFTAKNRSIATCGGFSDMTIETHYENVANAAHIVHCVNNHDALVDALQSARQFIENGIEYGYIKMPDEDTPDEAHNTLPKILKVLQEQGE